MFEEPADLEPRQVAERLRAWGIASEDVTYEPVGFGSHHYVAVDAAGVRWFVTVDDLDKRPWLGDRRAAFDAFDRAFRTAHALRRAGLPFVHAPRAAADGRVLLELEGRYAMSVFALIEGEGRPFGTPLEADERRRLVTALGQLHARTDAAGDLPQRDELEVPLRAELLAALDDVGLPWTGGPYSAPARELVAGAVDAIRDAFTRYDGVAGQALAAGDRWVVTHGEPHPGNILWTSGGEVVLVDWDTVQIGLPERDLWMVDGVSDDDLSAYAAAGGAPDVRREYLDLFRLRWALWETGIYVHEFRTPHRNDADTQESWANLAGYVAELKAWRS